MKSYCIISTVILLFMISCTSQPAKKEPKADEFQFFLEKFSDTKILRYPVPGFDQLPLQQKELIYYLSQAAVEGRDIMFDQNYRHNLAVRRTLEAIFENFTGDETYEDRRRQWEFLQTRLFLASGLTCDYCQNFRNVKTPDAAEFLTHNQYCLTCHTDMHDHPEESPGTNCNVCHQPTRHLNGNLSIHDHRYKFEK